MLINGESGKVVARINAAGFVTGFDVIDRSTIYDSAPTIDIIGGGGFGANALASLSCLDSETRDLLGYAKDWNWTLCGLPIMSKVKANLSTNILR